MTEYISQRDVDFWNELYSQPPVIIQACNKVVREQSRSLNKEWWHGIATAVSAILVAGAAVIWMCGCGTGAGYAAWSDGPPFRLPMCAAGHVLTPEGYCVAPVLLDKNDVDYVPAASPETK